MYGTRDAAVTWALEYTEALKSNGFRQGRATSCFFYNAQKDVSIMVHGDDLVPVGSGKFLDEEDAGGPLQVEGRNVGRGEGLRQGDQGAEQVRPSHAGRD